jgi:MFS family permease
MSPMSPAVIGMTDTAQLRRGSQSPFTPDERRALRTLVVSSAISKVADWQLGIVVPLAVLTETRSVPESLLAFASRALAYATAPVVGSLVDRFDRSAVFTSSQFQQALCLLAVALLITHPYALFVLLLLSGFGGVASATTGQFVLVPQLFSVSSRPQAAAKLGSVIEYSKVAGMLVGGLAIAAAGPQFASLCTALCYTAAGAVALRLPRARPSGTRSTLRADMGIGLRWLRQPEIWWLVASLSLMNLASGQIETVLVTLFEQDGLVAVVSSAILAAGLLLAGTSSRLAVHFMPKATPERRILTIQFLHATSLAIFCIPGLWSKILAYALHSFANGAINFTSIVYRQNVIPVEIAGRVNATMRMFISGSVPLSAAVYALAGHLRPSLYFTPGLCLMVLAVLVWALRVVRLRQERPELSVPV